MRRVTVIYDNGNQSVWKCSSASYGDQSRNMVMTDVDVELDVPHRVKYVLLPLTGVHFVTEEEW